jgi:hyperosmotically inducible protein
MSQEVRMQKSLLLALGLTFALGACGAPKRIPNPDNDATLDTRVRTALRNAPNVHANEIQVELSGGVATLRGAVHGQAEIDAAVAAARSVQGVRDVRSELTTLPPLDLP